MAYIRCASGGGGGAEVVEGTVTGASGSTSAGEFTITSQQGKAPSSITFWNTSTFTGSSANGIFWSDVNTSSARTWYSGSSSGVKTVGTEPSSVSASVKAVGANSITVACPTGGSNYNGTWKYIAVFE